MKTIEIVVSPNGTSRIETRGFSSAACQEASRFLERAWGAPPEKHSRRSSIRPKPLTRSTSAARTRAPEMLSKPTLRRLANGFGSLSPRHSLRSRSPALISPLLIFVEGSNDIGLLKGLSTPRSPNLLAWDDRANIVHS